MQFEQIVQRTLCKNSSHGTIDSQRENLYTNSDKFREKIVTR